MEESKQIHINCLWIAAALAAVFLLGAGCQIPIPIKEDNTRQLIKIDSLLEERKKVFAKRVYPDAMSTIQSGDLITRMGTDITSVLLSKINTKDTSFSHCGIAMIEQDTIFVYHTLGGEFNPDQKMLREPFYRFANPENSKAIGIFRADLTAGQKTVLSNHLVEKFSAGLMFDMDFDLATDERQYCAEMVAKSFGKAFTKLNPPRAAPHPTKMNLGDSMWQIKNNINEHMNWVTISKTENMQYISVESLYLNNKMHEIKRYHY